MTMAQSSESKWVYLRASKTGEVWVMRKEARKETTEKKKAIHSEMCLVMTLEQWWERWCYWIYKGLE